MSSTTMITYLLATVMSIVVDKINVSASSSNFPWKRWWYQASSWIKSVQLNKWLLTFEAHSSCPKTLNYIKLLHENSWKTCKWVFFQQSFRLLTCNSTKSKLLYNCFTRMMVTSLTASFLKRDYQDSIWQAHILVFVWTCQMSSA